MAKIKHTKNELKAQREALRRYERFLPMLQLKKIQLQAEIQSIDLKVTEKDAEEAAVRAALDAWVKLFSEPIPVDSLVRVEGIDMDEGNIAGVPIPILRTVRLQRGEPDLYTTPTWVDDAMETIGKLMSLRVEREVLYEQRRRISEELRTTSQRVNLFEKVKIPECSENIRIIKIFLGDEQTAGVVRGKISKRRMDTREEEAA